MKWTMEPFITVNGLKKAIEKVKEPRFGRTEANTQGIGPTIWPMVKVDSFMPMVMLTRVNGSVTKQMEEEHTNTWTERNTSETGKKTVSMDTELRPGLIMLNTKETMSTVRNTGSALSNGVMDPAT